MCGTPEALDGLARTLFLADCFPEGRTLRLFLRGPSAFCRFLPFFVNGCRRVGTKQMKRKKERKQRKNKSVTKSLTKRSTSEQKVHASSETR